MDLPEDHPVRVMHETLLWSWEQFKELCRKHEELHTQILDADFPTQAEEDRAVAVWIRQRDIIRRMAATVEWGFSTAGGILEEIWQEQKRIWVDGLDEELQELIRNPNR